MIIMKFGGTSVQDAAAMKNAIGITKRAKERTPLVVLSATAGTTDQLIKMIRSAASGSTNESSEMLAGVESRHKNIVRELITTDSLRSEAFQYLDGLFSEVRILIEGVALLRECTPKSIDSCSAYGELLSSGIFGIACRQEGIDSVFIDARRVMQTDSNHSNAKLNYNAVAEKTGRYFLPHLDEGKTIITQGFIGSDEKGSTTTIGRGGSDYSAAVFGAALGAEEIQIWTDVPGVLTADPKIVPAALTIPEMTFAEVREMSFFGAKVLHPETIKPAVEKNIPVRVLDTFHPGAPGTVILAKTSGTQPFYKSLVLKKNCILFKKELSSDEILPEMMSRIYGFIHSSGLPLISSYTSEQWLNIILGDDSEYDSDIRELAFQFGLDKYPVSLVCLCGSRSNENTGNMNPGISAILNKQTGLKTEACLAGANNSSTLIITGGGDPEKLLRELHDQLITDA